MDLEICFKIRTNVSNYEKASLWKPYKLLIFFYLKEAEMNIALFEYHGNHKKI